MPHVSPMHPLRMPDAELTHIHSISPLWGFGLDEGKGDGDGHASIMREASDSYASPMPFTNTNTVHLQQQVWYVSLNVDIQRSNLTVALLVLEAHKWIMNEASTLTLKPTMQ